MATTCRSKKPTAPLTARSSPLLIVVPTAIKSLVPDSVLEVSNVTISRALTNSLGANSYLPNQKVRTEFGGQLTSETKDTYPSIVDHASGWISSRVEHSVVGKVTLLAA